MTEEEAKVAAGDAKSSSGVVSAAFEKSSFSPGELGVTTPVTAAAASSTVVRAASEMPQQVRSAALLPSDLASLLTSTLVEKLREAQAIMAATAVRDAPESIKSTAGVVYECMAALSAVSRGV